MIIRKPYAFLMKHFRKIHILLLIFSIFVFYKTNTFLSFVKQYMNTKVYNPLVESVDIYASDLLFLVLILILISLGTIIFLLKRKKKPIIDYILVLSEYVFVFIVFIIGRRYFNNITDQIVSERSIRLVRDLLSISTFPQYIIFILFIIRILGIDLNRFGFKQDEEFNEISEDDREEVEVAVEFDKEEYKRQLRKKIRFLKYYYKENTLFINSIISIFVVVLIVVIGVIVSNGDKSFKEKKSFNANGYTITINNSYASKYDLSGNVIEKNNSFVILDVSVVNNSNTRFMDIEKFLLIGSKYKYVPTLKYNNYFKDLGNGYVKKELKKNSNNRFLLIYRVSNKYLKENKVMYYQNIKGNFKHNYMKVILNTKNLSKLKSNDDISLGNDLVINEKKINIESFEVGDKYSYLHKTCDASGCFITSSDLSGNGNKIVKLNLNTDDFDGYGFIDFLVTYGKIIYRIDGKQNEVKIKNPISNKYNGDSSYFLVNSNITNADTIYLSMTVRNNTYVYYLKGGKESVKANE